MAHGQRGQFRLRLPLQGQDQQRAAFRRRNREGDEQTERDRRLNEHGASCW
jgi:hypothetical protein